MCQYPSPCRRPPLCAPIARLASELSVTGVGQFALGFAVLAVALTSSDIEPARAVVPFVVTFVAAQRPEHLPVALAQGRGRRRRPIPGRASRSRR